MLASAATAAAESRLIYVEDSILVASTAQRWIDRFTQKGDEVEVVRSSQEFQDALKQRHWDEALVYAVYTPTPPAWAAATRSALEQQRIDRASLNLAWNDGRSFPADAQVLPPLAMVGWTRSGSVVGYTAPPIEKAGYRAATIGEAKTFAWPDFANVRTDRYIVLPPRGSARSTSDDPCGCLAKWAEALDFCDQTISVGFAECRAMYGPESASPDPAALNDCYDAYRRSDFTCRQFAGVLYLGCLATCNEGGPPGGLGS